LRSTISTVSEHGVAILGRDDSDPNGRFAWFLDPADIKVELWEPKG
jgi:predicted enzyme related to lactoylglutathione lyase